MTDKPDQGRGPELQEAAEGLPVESPACPDSETGEGNSPSSAPETRPADFRTPDGASGTPSPSEVASAYLDQLQRLKAEFDNYRKRIGREREDWSQAARAGVVQQLLPVVDDLRRARSHGSGPDEVPDAAGLYLILKRLEDLLQQLGLVEQDAPGGTVFDPEQHEAVMVSPSDELPEGQILEAVEPGYLFQGRLLRRSRVRVSSGPVPE